jgi:hypothetical protein
MRSGRTPPRRPPRLLRRRMRTTVSPRPSPSISVELSGIVRIQLPVARLLKHQTMQKFGPARADLACAIFFRKILLTIFSRSASFDKS